MVMRGPVVLQVLISIDKPIRAAAIGTNHTSDGTQRRDTTCGTASPSLSGNCGISVIANSAVPYKPGIESYGGKHGRHNHGAEEHDPHARFGRTEGFEL